MNEERKETYECECIECGHPMTSEKHCKDLCLSDKVKVLLLDGRALTIPKIMQELDNNKNIWVYSSKDNGQFIPQRIKSAQQTKFDKMLRITLDNGKSFECTYDHLVMMRDGSYRRADKLSESDSVMPFYTMVSEKSGKQKIGGYRFFWDLLKNKWRPVHLWVVKELNLHHLKGGVVHHGTFDKLNNNPNALEILTHKEHQDIHVKHLKQLWSNPITKAKLIAKISKSNSETCRKRPTYKNYVNPNRLPQKDFLNKINSNPTEAMLKQRLIWVNNGKKWLNEHPGFASKRSTATINQDIEKQCPYCGNWIKGKHASYAAHIGHCRRMIGLSPKIVKERNEKGQYLSAVAVNHKILSIEKIEAKQGYDITVEGISNFAIAAGLFVHNSCPECGGQMRRKDRPGPGQKDIEAALETRPEVGRNPTGKHTQSILFVKDKWTKSKSKSWLASHKNFTDGYDEGDDYYRWRQYDPDSKKFRYANEIIEGTKDSPSIILVLGFPKGSKKEGGNMKSRSISKSLTSLIERECGDDVDVQRNDEGRVEVTLNKPLMRKLVMESEVRAVEGEDDVVELSFSSEEPVLTFWRSEPEILSHEPDDADFSQLNDVGAILRNHDPDQIIGVPTEVWLDVKERKGKMKMRFGTTEIAQQAKREALTDKTLRGVSVGYQISKLVYLEDKETSYQGRINGPAWIGARWKAYEASLTPIPADGTVGINRNKTGGNEMSDPKEVKKVDPSVTVGNKGNGGSPPGAVEPGTPTEEQRKQIADQERSRGIEIGQLCRAHKVEDKAEGWIKDGLSVDQVRESILTHLAESNAAVGNIEVKTNAKVSRLRAMSEGLLMRAHLVERDKDEHGGRDFAGMSLLDMARDYLTNEGVSVKGMDKMAIAERALRGPLISAFDLAEFSRGAETIAGSSDDFPYILANLANKSMIGAAVRTPTTWRGWAKTGNLSDFKSAPRIKMSEAGDLEEIPEGKPYPSTNFSESQETIILLTYGKKFSITRKAIINDDMDAFTTIPARLGRAAERLPNQLAVTVLLANANLNDGIALFANGHRNYSANANYALDTLAHAEAGLRNAFMTLRLQRAMLSATEADKSHTVTLGLQPKIALAGPTNEFILSQALRSGGALADNKNAGVINPLSSVGVSPIIEPLLEDTNITGYSTLAFYIFADPADAPIVEVAFLNGNETPHMEEVDQTDVDGRVFKVRQDCVAGAIDYAGAFKQKGEA